MQKEKVQNVQTDLQEEVKLLLNSQTNKEKWWIHIHPIREKPWLLKIAMTCSLITTIMLLVGLILFSVMEISWTNIIDPQVFENVQTFSIMLFSFAFAFGILITISWVVTDLDKILNNKMQFILLSVLSLMVINIGILIYVFETNKGAKSKRHLSWKLFGIRKLSIHDVVLCGMFTALTIVFAYTEQFMPQLPNGGGIALKYLPLITLGVVCSPVLSILAGGASALMSLLFLSSGLIISPWSYLLDYFIPMMIPGIISMLKFKITRKNGYISYLNYIIVGFFTFLGIYIIQTISGYFVWVAAFGPSWGDNGWVYSIIYNGISVWALSYPVNQVLMVPMIKVSLLINRK
ncbi:energy-coupled thiamine transporter ThiT [Williamsoniiplasma luminosum]|uniref:Thiamine transporter n=1 Tax=Williamsoniiplasma luminosum TaxID=214888 RepID=A0A2S0NKS9_9MOLU|nr:energy-coupled thiamine transporter ThiT [Williamsoniiplasma luminosum]AVP49605.1 MAG: hypothetical protein C5T88_03460 [Williamsoniiplasma luminosum]